MKFMTPLLLALMGASLFAADVEVVELPLPKSDHVTIKLMFRVGSIDDPAGKEGLTSLTASVVGDGGTDTLSKPEIDELLYPMAVGVGLSVDKEALVYTMTSHRDNLDKAYDVMRGLMLAPRFDQADYDRIKKAIEKAVAQDIPENNDEVLSKRALDWLMFQGHPYGHLVQGTEAGLAAITLDDVKAHYKRYFAKKRLLIGIAGGYSKSFKDKLVADMNKLPEGDDNFVELPKVPMPKGIEAVVVEKPRAFGSALFYGYPMDIDRSDNEFAALMVANSHFGEHRKSYGVLYNKMRTARSLNYGDYSYIEWYPGGHATQLPFSGTPRRQNFFSIWIRPVQIANEFKAIPGLEDTKVGNGVFVIRQSLRELEKLVDAGMTQADFELKRKFLIGYLKLYVQDASSRLGFLMDSRFYGRKDYINEMIALLEKLTLEDVNAAIKKHLQPENFYLAVITDKSEAQPLADALKNNLSAPIVYKPAVRNGLPKEITDEDAKIDAYKLKVTSVKVVKNSELFKK